MASKQKKSGVLNVVLILTFAVLPLVYVKNIIDHTLLPRQIFGCIATLSLLLFSWPRLKDKLLGLPFVLLGYAGFVVINFIALSQAINVKEGWGTLSRYLLFFAFFATLLWLVRSRLVSTGNIIKAMLFFGASSALITLGQLFEALASGDFFNDIYTVKALFSHKNLLSSALMLSLPFAVMGAGTFTKTGRNLSLALVFLIVAEIFVLRTRGVWLGTFAGAFATVVLLLFTKKKYSFKVDMPYKLLGVGAGLALVLLVALFSAPGIQEKVTSRTNIENRVAFWENTVQMVGEHPVLGVGPGNWKINFPKYGLQKLDNQVQQGITHVQRPHNDFLWVLSESGPLGLIFYLGVFALALWKVIKNLKNAQSRQELAVDLSVFFGLVAFLTFSFGDFPLERTPHNFLALTLIVLLYRNDDSRDKVNLKGRVALVITMLITGFSLVVAAYRFKGEKYGAQVMVYNAQRNAQKIVPAAENAVNPFFNMDNFANPMYYYSSLGKLVSGNAGAAWLDAQMAHDAHPYNVVVINQMGNVKKQQKKPDEALEYYEQALAIAPRFLAGKLSIAQIYVDRNKPVEAMEIMLTISPKTTDPRYHQVLGSVLAQLYTTRSEHGKYPNFMRLAEKRNPKNPQELVEIYLGMFNL